MAPNVMCTSNSIGGCGGSPSPFATRAKRGAKDATGATGANVPAAGDGQLALATTLATHGVTGAKLADLRGQIDQAVASAKRGGGDAGAVRLAIDGVLKKAGVDLATVAGAPSPGSAAGITLDVTA